VEAWIEILAKTDLDFHRFVASFVEAWIEIKLDFASANVSPSLPSWKRGLKSKYPRISSTQYSSLPSWKRGLKLEAKVAIGLLSASLPSWKRGLKCP